MNFDQPKKESTQIPENKIKKGVDFVFEQNPELTQIGTEEQYSKYLDTIFPESKVKDIVYHGAIRKFEEFDTERSGLSGRNFGKGIYVTLDKNHANDYALGEDGTLVSLVVDLKNPFITCHHYKDWHGAHLSIPYNEKMTKYINNDSVLNYEYLDRDFLRKINEYLVEYFGEKDTNGLPVYQKNIRTNPQIREIVLPEVEQTHILGSKKDIERFREFVSKLK